MPDFIGNYRNPIFGILILLFIIFLIAITDFIRAKHGQKKKQKALDNLSKNFESVDLNQNIQAFLTHTKNATPTLMLIAQTYSKVGNNEQAIAIYKTLNEKNTNPNEKIQILESLGVSYYKAGFLERSKTIFLEILRNYPHNVKILEFYMQTCENLRQYDEALEALNCIEELCNDTSSTSHYDTKKINHIKNYLKVMQISNNHKLPLLAQQESLLEIYEQDSSVRSIILRHFKVYNTGLFWKKMLKIENIYPYIDILWSFKEHEIPLDSIKSDSQLLDVYRAKGFIKQYQQIDNFALESLQLLHLYSHLKGDLRFNYLCHSCKGQSPFYSYRCPVCNEIGNIEILISPIPLYNQAMYLEY